MQGDYLFQYARAVSDKGAARSMEMQRVTFSGRKKSPLSKISVPNAS